jgi:hypothetical protein
MTAGRTTTVITLVLLATIASTTAAANEIYHWLDENGVQNFSQKPPDGQTPGVSKMNLVDTTPPDYDPEEDRYGVQAQAERMEALREEMEQERDAARERERNAAQQQPVQYRDPYRSYSHGIWLPPIYPGPPHRPRPPHKPQPPIEVPYPTSTLRPPGR